MREPPIRVLAIDDQPVVRRALETVITDAEDMVFLGAAADGETGVDLAIERQPDVVLVDLSMPGGLDGIETTKRLLAQCPGITVLIFSAEDGTSFAGHEQITAAISAGAAATITKDATPEILVSAIRAAVASRLTD